MTLRTKVESLGGLFVDFERKDDDRIADIRAMVPTDEVLRELRGQVMAAPVDERPCVRYQVEYETRCYGSYKPGIDDDDHRLGSLTGGDIPHSRIVEIGGGPSHVAERGQIRVCVDLVEHPRLKNAGVEFVQGDICDKKAVGRIIDRARPEVVMPTLVVMSYCLDRVENQRRALAHFAEIIGKTRGVGLVTVCLPAKPVSPGFDGQIHYTDGGQTHWVTRGEDPLDDYARIVGVCHEEGLRFTRGGRTTHYGSSLDGYEELPCYVLVFNS